MWTRSPPTRCRSVRGWARSRRRESDPGLHRGLALSLPGGGLPRPYPARPTTHSRAELRPQWYLRKYGDAAERAQNAVGVRPLRHRQRQRPAGCGTAARRSDRDKKGTIDRTAHRLDKSVYRRNRFTISSLGLEAPSGFEQEMEVLQTSQRHRIPLGFARFPRRIHRGEHETLNGKGRGWSGKRDSNPRLQPWQGCTLPLSYSRSHAVWRKDNIETGEKTQLERQLSAFRVYLD